MALIECRRNALKNGPVCHRLAIGRRYLEQGHRLPCPLTCPSEANRRNKERRPRCSTRRPFPIMGWLPAAVGSSRPTTGRPDRSRSHIHTLRFSLQSGRKCAKSRRGREWVGLRASAERGITKPTLWPQCRQCQRRAGNTLRRSVGEKTALGNSHQGRRGGGGAF